MKYKLQNLLIILTAALFFTACEKEENFDQWKVSGVIVYENELGNDEPIANVPIYLLSSDFEIDTLTSLIMDIYKIDSTITDASGKYSFSQILPGEYFVFPFDTIASYQFHCSQEYDAQLLSPGHDKVDFTVNFDAQPIMAENGWMDDYREVRYNTELGILHYIITDVEIVVQRQEKNYTKWVCDETILGACVWGHFTYTDFYWTTSDVVELDGGYSGYGDGIGDIVLLTDPTEFYKYSGNIRIKLRGLKKPPISIPPVLFTDTKVVFETKWVYYSKEEVDEFWEINREYPPRRSIRFTAGGSVEDGLKIWFIRRYDDTEIIWTSDPL